MTILYRWATGLQVGSHRLKSTSCIGSKLIGLAIGGTALRVDRGLVNSGITLPREPCAGG
jgi:hypothetical protein